VGDTVRKKLTLWLGPPLAWLLIHATRLTMRVSRLNVRVVEDLRDRGRPYVHAFWHGQLFLMPYSYVGRRIAIMISAHSDGELIARTMKLFGHGWIKGSTTSGGAGALRAAVRALRAGTDVGFTPDGPRGPRHQAQMGAIQAARLAGAPIVPVAFAASHGKKLSSWDQFQVPLPFSRGVFVYGEPMEIPVAADDAEMERARRALEESLNALTGRAEALAVGTKPVPGKAGERHV
jgi:lysophospholipid acyltransferase (LPLAT)-like uncharacterized protein